MHLADQGGGCSRGLVADGERERAPLTRRRVDPDSPTVPLDDLLHDRQAGARAAAELVAAVQTFEDPENCLLMLCRNADAVVAHPEHRPGDPPGGLVRGA